MVSAKGSDSATFDCAAGNSHNYREDTRSFSITTTWSVGRTYEYIEYLIRPTSWGCRGFKSGWPWLGTVCFEVFV